MMHRRYFGNSARAFSSMKSNVITFTMLEEKADTIMKKLSSRGETVGTAETSSGGLISASLFSSPVGKFKLYKKCCCYFFEIIFILYSFYCLIHYLIRSVFDSFQDHSALRAAEYG